MITIRGKYLTEKCSGWKIFYGVMILMECLSEVSYLACEASSKSSVSCVSVRAFPRVSQSLPEKYSGSEKIWRKKSLPAGWLYRRPEKGSSVLRVTVMESALHSRLTETRRTLLLRVGNPLQLSLDIELHA